VSEDISLNGRLLVSGNVGIGLTNPNYALDVTSASNPFRVGAGTNASALVVDSNGRVGVRTDNPSANLDIRTAASTSVSDEVYDKSAIKIQNASIANNTLSSILLTVGDGTTGTTVTNSTNVNAFYSADVIGNYGFSHGISANSNRYSFKNNYKFTGREILTLLNNGNVGIGTTNPGYALDVSSASNPFRVGVPGVNSSALVVDSNGRVGVGTGSTAYQFQIFGGTNNNVGLGTTAAPFSNTMLYFNNNVGLGSTAGNYTSLMNLYSNLISSGSHLSIYNYRYATGSTWTSASTRIQQTIDGTNMAYIEFNPPGNSSGIGLYVNSSANLDASTKGITINSSGSVGIGTTNPGYALDISGNVRCSGGYQLNYSSVPTYTTSHIGYTDYVFKNSNFPTLTASTYTEILNLTVPTIGTYIIFYTVTISNMTAINSVPIIVKYNNGVGNGMATYIAQGTVAAVYVTGTSSFPAVISNTTGGISLQINRGTLSVTILEAAIYYLRIA